MKYSMRNWQEKRKFFKIPQIFHTIVHLLNQFEIKVEENQKLLNQIQNIKKDFSIVLEQNEVLRAKIQYIENQKDDFQNKIQEAETYISQISKSQCSKSNVQQLQFLPLKSLQIPFQIKYHSHLTQRPALYDQKDYFKFDQKEELELKIIKFEKTISQKNTYITQLEIEVKILKDRIIGLENEIFLKSSQLELSEMYYRQKIDIIKTNQSCNKFLKESINIGELQLNSIFRNQLSRVSSVKSIDSIVQSQSSIDQRDKYETQNYVFKQKNIEDMTNNKTRRSLMQDFATDFVLQVSNCQKSQNFNDISLNSSNCSLLRQRKTIISISTADMRNTSAKGVQTTIEIMKPNKYSSKTNSNKKSMKKPTKNSFLDLSSITSLFTKSENKKNEKIYNYQNVLSGQTDKFQQQRSDNNDQVSPITNLLKGIFEYATKKIVTQRITKKKGHQAALNQGRKSSIYYKK